jgi:hypothetical protein
MTNIASVIGTTTWWVSVSDTGSALITVTIPSWLWWWVSAWWYGWWITGSPVSSGIHYIAPQQQKQETPSVCPYTDWDFESYKQTMGDIPRTWQVRNAIYNLLDHCVVHGKNGEGKKYGTYDRLTYGEMYKIVIRSLGLSFKPQQLWQHRAESYKKVAAKEWLLNGIDQSPSLDDVVDMAQLKYLLKNILYYNTSWQDIEEYLQRIDAIRTPYMLRGNFAKLVDYYILDK